MPLCLAYGSNMDTAAMAARCPRSVPLGAARLARFRFAIMTEGYATVRPDPRACVWGLLWNLDGSDMSALDRYEGVAAGLYRKATCPVLTEGGVRRALIYLGRPSPDGRPLPGYMEGVLEAARAASLPDVYRRELAFFAPGRPARRLRSMAP